jgi:hypothetical protein
LKNLKKVPLEILGRVPSGKVKRVSFRRLVRRWEAGGKVVNPAEKQKVANGGQVGGQLAVSEIRWVGGKTLDFLDEMD